MIGYAELTIADAAFDVVKQNDQIETLAASRPDALIILAMDPASSARSVNAATKAGVPVFLLNTYVPNATATTLSMSDEYGMGAATARYMAEKIGGSGKIGVMNNNFNEIWAQRRTALQDVLRDEFPDIEIASEWSFDATGKTTSRTAADSFLAANPDLKGIWCAWDNAAMESSLAALSAGRPDLITTGIDGGSAAFEVLRAGGPFKFTCAIPFYTQALELVKFAHQHASGIKVPRIVVTPTYGVTKDVLDAAGPLADDYEKPGIPEKLGWQRIL